MTVNATSPFLERSFFMKIVRPICGGMDVHKNIIVATIGITDKKSRVTEYIQESFTTLNPDLFRLRDWLISHNCYDVCMESTGKYWIPIFNILENEFNVCLTHPKYVKAIKGKKTDKKDSKWICDIFKHDLVKSSFIPPQPIRELREVSRYRYKLVCMRSSERNRYQNSMTVSNIGLASVLSDPFGKTASNIMSEILSSDSIDEKKILSLVHGRCKNKDKILDSLIHSNISTDQRFKLNTASIHMQELTTHIDACEVEMVTRALPYKEQIDLLSTIPGLTPFSAIVIISEIGVDMSQFESDKQLVSWAGLAPCNNESAGKKKSVRISKAGQYLKPLLVQIALASIKSKGSYFQLKYQRFKKRRGHKKAIIAIARMILVCIYHMLSKMNSFNPVDYESLKNPKPFIKKQELDIDTALTFLKQQGFDVSSIQVYS